MLEDAAEVSAIGFKAVHARKGSPACTSSTKRFSPRWKPSPTWRRHIIRPIPARCGCSASGSRGLPLVAAFETGFHRTIPEASQRYAIPDEWATELGIRRWGFHGASHRYIAGPHGRAHGPQSDIKVISCHLGGSSSLCAMRNGESIACSLGMSPQSGLPHNNRVGDFDVFALPVILRETGKTLDASARHPGQPVGTRGLSGAGCDLRDIEAAAAAGQRQGSAGHRRLHRLDPPLPGRYLVELDGADAIVFTGGIGENSSAIRAGVCRDLRGSASSSTRTSNACGAAERRSRPSGSRVQVWCVPTNEEIVVARQAKQLLEQSNKR